MAAQQKIYEYSIYHCTANQLQEIFNNIRVILLRLDNLLIVSYGDCVTLVIDLAEQLQRSQIARKIRVDLSLNFFGQNAIPKVMILMSRVMTPEIPLNMAPNFLIVVDPFINSFQDACCALERGKILQLVAYGDSIPYLVFLFGILRQFDFITRISILTSNDERTPWMEIVMQGVIPLQLDPSHNVGLQYCLLQRQQHALDTFHPFGIPPHVPGYNLPPQVVQFACSCLGPSSPRILGRSLPPPVNQSVAMNAQIQEDHQQLQNGASNSRVLAWLEDQTQLSLLPPSGTSRSSGSPPLVDVKDLG